MGDRGGGRERKGGSLKTSAKNPGCTAGKGKTEKKKVEDMPTESLPCPAVNSDGPYFDCGAAILSRQFERDRDRALARSKDEGCSAVVQWFADVEKQQAVADLSRDFSGHLYFLTGIHPDNVDRTNKKNHGPWLEKVEELARRPECVGLLSGFNLIRDPATLFAQESLLKSTLTLARKLCLPVVLHLANDGSSIERVVDVLTQWLEEFGGESETPPPRIMFHDIISACNSDVAKLQLLQTLPPSFPSLSLAYSFSGAGISDPSSTVASSAKAFVPLVPSSALHCCSDSPWRTPQNLPDEWLRSQRNEPANVSAIVYALSAARGEVTSKTADLLQGNSQAFFNVPKAGADAKEAFATKLPLPPTTAATAAGATTKGKGKGKGDAAKGKAAAAHEQESESEEEAKPDKRTYRVGPAKQAPLLLLPALPPAAPAAPPDPYYGCPRCRSKLFKPSDLVSHGGESVLESSHCPLALFVPSRTGGPSDSVDSYFAASGEGDGDKGSGAGLCVGLGGVAVACRECGFKVGRFSRGQARCGCGAAVDGPVGKISGARVDFFDGVDDAAVLASRSLKEAEEYVEEDDEEDDDGQAHQVGKKKRSKMKVKTGKGNYSLFRNKSFVTSAETDSGLMGRKKYGPGGKGNFNKRVGNIEEGGADDDDDDDDDEQEFDEEVGGGDEVGDDDGGERLKEGGQAE